MFIYLFLSGVCEICAIVMGYNNVAARCRRRRRRRHRRV